MKKSSLSGYLLVICIASFLATFIFVVQRSYDNLMEPINSAKQSDIIKPIDLNLDVDILNEIENRKFYSDDQPASIIITPAVATQ